MPYVDFEEVKKAVSIEDAAKWLKLDLKPSGNQFRCPCPTCGEGGERALAITPPEKWYCFPGKLGGDVIRLVAHVRGIGQKEAAEELAKAFLQPRGRDTKPQPRPEARQEAPEGLQALSYLEYDHPAVEAVGLSASDAEALGVGYAGRGIMRGFVAVPVRLEDGTLSGYLGITEAKLPPRWFLPERKVVPMARKSA